MSWLNDSLNKVKGTISSFAQDVLEGSVNDEENNQISSLNNPQELEVLKDLCATQDNEITTLRRQIVEQQQQLQQQQQQITNSQSIKLGETAGTSGKTLSDAPLEDSWFWDPDNNTISSTTSSSKKDENESPVGGDLTNIPLDSAVSENDVIDKLSKQNAEKDQKLKRVLLENAILNEKLGQISNENRELNSNLEELDKQHNMAIEKVLSVKNNLHADFNKLKDDYTELQKQNIAQEYEMVQELNKLKEIIGTLNQNAVDMNTKYEKVEKSLVNASQNNIESQNEIAALKEEIKRIVCENVESSLLYEAKEKELNLNYDNFIAEKCKLEANYTDIKQKYDELMNLNLQKGETLLRESNELLNVEKQKLEDSNAVSEQENNSSTSSATQTTSSVKVENEEIAALRTRIDEIVAEKNKLEEEYYGLQDSKLDLQRAFHEYKSTTASDANNELISELQDIIKQITVEKQKWEEDFIALQDKSASSSSSNTGSNELIAQLKAEIEQLKVEKYQVEVDFNVLQDDNLDLQREYHAYKAEVIQNPVVIPACTNEWQDDNNVVKIEATSTTSSTESGLIAELKAQIEQLKVEKYQVEVDFNVLQDADLDLQREFRLYKAEVIQSKTSATSHSDEKDEFNDQQESIDHLAAENRKLRDELQAIEIKNSSLGDNVETLKAAKQQVEAELTTLQEMQKQIESEFSDMKFKHNKVVAENSNIDDLNAKLSNLSIEKRQIEEDFNVLLDANLDLQREFSKLTGEMNDLRSNHSLLKTQLEGFDPDEQTFTNSEVKQLLKRYFSYESDADVANYLEEFLIKFKDVHSKLLALEKNFIESSALCNSLKVEKENLLQERDNLKSDLNHYELECSDLSKNNDLLITEIENLKCSKLETINENCEDSIVSLEKQLEDCSNLNQGLEVEFEELQTKYQQLEQQVMEYKNNQKQFKIQIDVLENEKSNLLFEINELQVNDQNAVSQEENTNYEKTIESLRQQLATISQEHSQLSEMHQSQQTAALENIKRLEESIQLKDSSVTQIDQTRKHLEDKLSHQDAEIVELRNAIGNITSELQQEKTKANDYLTEMKKYQEKLFENTNDRKFLDEITTLKTTIDNMNKEKNELIGLITIKHNENIQYHQEIQRLNQLLYLEIEKTKNFSCSNCTSLQNELAKLQQSSITSHEVEKFNDQIHFLREKSDILTQNLVAEQANQKLVHQEKLELVEQKNDLARDLDRLRQHLLEVEDAHTQETVELQKVIDETKTKLMALENDAKQTSTAYTSASIRANQQAETLQSQYMLLSQQRDELLGKLGLAEDTQLKNQAALTNLQCALEQFQRNKEKDIETANHIIRKELDSEKMKQNNLMKEMQLLQQQLTEAKNGLLAAARISDQLEISQVTIAQLKEELMKSEEKYTALEKKLHDNETSQVEKVEKNLVKNLIIGYVVAPNQSDKTQILKLISAVLTLDQNECDKIGLNRSQSGWLSSILTGGGTSSNQNANYNKESLAQAFVQFLEKESQPRNTGGPNLLNLMTRVTREDLTSTPTVTTSIAPGASSNSNGNTVLTASTTQPPVQPVLLNDSILQQSFAPPRNSSSILKDILYDS